MSLKARLRAKFPLPRRTSGLSVQAHDKTSAPPSTSGSETPSSRRLSDAAGVANGGVNARPRSKTGNGGARAPPIATDTAGARDRLRQEETSKQESGSAQKPAADVRQTAIDTAAAADDNNNSNNSSASDSASDSDADDDSSEDGSQKRVHQSETQCGPVVANAAAANADPMHRAMSGRDTDSRNGTLHHAGKKAANTPRNADQDASSPNATAASDRNTFQQEAAEKITAASRISELNDVSPSPAANLVHSRRIKLTDTPVESPSTTTAPGHGDFLTVPSRPQSLLPSRQSTLIRTLLSPGQTNDLEGQAANLLPMNKNMVRRKIWVKRPGASATLIAINEDDLVDDARDTILRKYAHSLGRHFDPPDLNLRITPREHRQERMLSPDEPLAKLLDAYFPGGQTVDEALIIDIPPRKTPGPSPRTGPPHAQHLTSVYLEEARPSENGTDYFGPEALVTSGPSATLTHGATHPHAISVLSTGQVPQIPSPGGTRSRTYRDRPDRPRLGRQHTSSPTIINIVGAGGHAGSLGMAASHDLTGTGPPPPPPLPSPPAQEVVQVPVARTATPPPRTASPRPPVPRPKKKKTIADHPTFTNGILNVGVPPINVLIVEDNIINLRLLEAFVKRLKVRWQTAMNGQEAVTKWRAGGFHLVLMDIQLPVMSGLEATREIRRLERMNSISAFFSSPKPNTDDDTVDPGEAATFADRLENRKLFKSPVIIVALTASSLQSDRHEALAAGCNDFLTKPVAYHWLERKVKEWGCMQALIDFNGWRKWKALMEKDAEDGANRTVRAKS